jgi:superoxide reductase
MKIFICQVCGHIEFDAAPEKCPVCMAQKFNQNDSVFEDSMRKSKEGAVKHIPEVGINKECGLIPEAACTDVLVRIGKTLHPMTENHYIQWIDCYLDKKYVSRIMLTPEMNPSVVFHLKPSGSRVIVVENCNIHGFWKTEVNI